MMTDDLLGPVLRQDYEPLEGRRSHLKPRFVATQLTVRRHAPSALGLDDDVEFRRLDLDVRKPAVGLVVFLKLDDDGLRQDDTRREAFDEPAEEGGAARQAPPEGRGHVVLVVAEQVKDGLDWSGVKDEFWHDPIIDGSR